MEAEQGDYKEAGAVTAKAAKGTDPELMEELASIKAVVKKAWNAQQNSQQKSKKQGNEKRDANNNPPGKKKRNDACYGCGRTGHFVKNCPNPHKSSLNSKRGGKKSKTPPNNSSSSKEGSWNFNPGSGYCSRRGTDPRRWARTGLESETLVYLNFVPFDAILDFGFSISTIDVTVCEYLKIPIRPFICDFTLSSGFEGALMTKAHVAVMGWIEV